MLNDESTLATFVVIILPLIALLALLTLLIVLRMSARLRRVEALLPSTQSNERDVVATKRTENQKKEQSDFDKFIAEDGTRRLLSKREQAAAFREWRRQRGITWGADEN